MSTPIAVLLGWALCLVAAVLVVVIVHSVGRLARRHRPPGPSPTSEIGIIRLEIPSGVDIRRLIDIFQQVADPDAPPAPPVIRDFADRLAYTLNIAAFSTSRLEPHPVLLATSDNTMEISTSVLCCERPHGHTGPHLPR